MIYEYNIIFLFFIFLFFLFTAYPVTFSNTTCVYIVVVRAVHVTLCPLICTYFTRMVGS